jgi:hypothetical protein
MEFSSKGRLVIELLSPQRFKRLPESTTGLPATTHQAAQPPRFSL